MKSVIDNLYKCKTDLQEQQSSFRINTDHGSADQTRSILFQSMFELAIGNIHAAIKQMQILEKQLYS